MLANLNITHSILMAKNRILRQSLFTLAYFSIGTASLYANANENWMRESVAHRVSDQNLVTMPNNAVKADTNNSASSNARHLTATHHLQRENPFQVALVLKDIKDNAEAHFCSGALIASNYVVTAAHCSDFMEEDKVQVLTSKQNLNNSDKRWDVKKITVHPKWNATTFDNDIAVWELSGNIPGDTFATLSKSDAVSDEGLYTKGQGTGVARPDSSVIDATRCDSDEFYSGNIKNSMFCSTDNSHYIDTCGVASGSPITREKDPSMLYGIASWGGQCVESNTINVVDQGLKKSRINKNSKVQLPKVYTRISSPAIYDFITATTQKSSFRPVVFVVHDDNFQYPSERSEAIYFRRDASVCVPNGTSVGNCRQFFRGYTGAHGIYNQKVNFQLLDDDHRNMGFPVDELWNISGSKMCAENTIIGASSRECDKKWFRGFNGSNIFYGSVQCVLFDDNDRNITLPASEFYYRRGGAVCIGDGTSVGTCRKWLGRCSL